MAAQPPPPPTRLGSRIGGAIITFQGFVVMLVAQIIAAPSEPFHHTGWLVRLLAAIPLAIAYIAILALVARFIVRNESMRYLSLFGAAVFALPVAYVVLGAINVVADSAPGKPRPVRLVAFEQAIIGRSRNAKLEWVDPPADSFDVPSGATHLHEGGVGCFRQFSGALGFEYVRAANEADCGSLPSPR